MNKAQKIAFGVFVISWAVGVGASMYTIKELEKLRETARRNAAAAEYAHARIRDKIWAGGYEGMTTAEIERQVHEDYEFFVLTGRTELDEQLGEPK